MREFISLADLLEVANRNKGFFEKHLIAIIDIDNDSTSPTPKYKNSIILFLKFIGSVLGVYVLVIHSKILEYSSLEIVSLLFKYFIVLFAIT